MMRQTRSGLRRGEDIRREFDEGVAKDKAFAKELEAGGLRDLSQRFNTDVARLFRSEAVDSANTGIEGRFRVDLRDRGRHSIVAAYTYTVDSSILPFKNLLWIIPLDSIRSSEVNLGPAAALPTNACDNARHQADSGQ